MNAGPGLGLRQVVAGLYARYRPDLLVRVPRWVRRISYKKPDDWDEMTYSRKIKWRCQNPDPSIDYPKFVDKHLVKRTVARYFDSARVYDLVTDPESIDTGKLPPTYVMKATTGWDMSLLVFDGVIRGQNRTAIDMGRKADKKSLVEIAGRWLDSPEASRKCRKELHYRYIKPRIVFEEFLHPIDCELQHFLFFGKCKLARVIRRGFDHSGQGDYCFYDENWNAIHSDIYRSRRRRDVSAGSISLPRYDLLDKLESVCSRIDHVRADFFIVDNRPYFSEFTFTHAGGKNNFSDEWSQKLGQCWYA